MSPAAKSRTQVNNARTRVTEWRFAPGAATGFHRHDTDYVIVPLTAGRLKLVDKEGKESSADLVAGQSYFRQAGVEHDVVNVNDFEFAFVEVELK